MDPSDNPYDAPQPADDAARAAEPEVEVRHLVVDPRDFRRQTKVAAIVIVIVGIVVYFNSLWGELVFDDVGWIILNPTIRNVWDLPMVLYPPNNGFASGRPVLNLTIAINYALGGTAPGGYHVVNIAIHIAAALALFGIVRRTLLTPRMRGRFVAVAAPLALATAVLWMVHPLQTASVTYVIQRTESLMGLFFFVTLYCVIRGADSANPNRWYIAALAACVLGMGTKEVMAAAPPVVLLYDRAFLSGSLWRALRARWLVYLGMATSWGVIALCLLSSGFHSGSAGFGSGFTWKEYAGTQPEVITHYLRLTFWPVGQCLDYTWPKVEWDKLEGEDLWLAAAPVALIASLGLITLWGVLRNTPLGFLGAWFFLILAPTSSFVPIRDAAFEHRMYLPLAAIAALVVVGGYALWDRFAPCDWATGSADPRRRWRLPIAAVALAAIALSLLTMRRNAMFHSAVSVWEDVVESNPKSARGQNNLAAVLIEDGRCEEAIAHSRQALEISPGYADAENNMGHALNQQGKEDQAAAWFEKAVAHNPKHARALQNLAAARFKKKRIAEATDLYRRLLVEEPDNFQGHLRLADCLRETKPQESIEQYRKALEILPDNAEAKASLDALVNPPASHSTGKP